MRNNLLKLFQSKEKLNVAVYMLTDIFAKGIPFLLLPFYTRFLTPEQFGNLSIFNVIVEICIIFVVFGANSYYRVEYFRANDNQTLVTQLLTNILITFLITILGMGVFTLLGVNPGTQSTTWLFLAVIIAISQSVVLLMIAEFQLLGKAIFVGLINLSAAFFAALLTVVLLMNGGEENSRYIGYLVSSIIAMLIAITLYKSIYGKYPLPSFKLSKESFSFGVGILPHVISWWARSGVDRILIATFLTLSQVGLYSIAAQLSLVIIVISNSINQALIPKIIKMLTSGEHKSTFILCMKIIAIYLAFSFMFFTFSPFIFDWFIDDKYLEAKKFLLLMCVSAFLQSSVALLGNILYFHKKVKWLSSVTFSCSVLHVVFAYFLISNYGVFGVIWSSIFTYLIALLVILSLSIYLTKHHSQPITNDV